MSAVARVIAASGMAFSLLALCACNSTAPSQAGVAPAAPEPPAPGVVGTVVGRELAAADREKAIAAQQEAVNSGARKSWRGAHGSFGFIEPGPEGALGGCRDYTHKIYVKGRPEEATGRACKKPDGSYRVTS